MNKDIWEGKWQQWKGRIKQQWSRLTDDDLGQIEGDREVIVGKLQERYGRSKEEAQREWQRFIDAGGRQETA